MTRGEPATDADLERLQHDSFTYFLNEANPANGLVIDKTAPNWPASIAATGLALAAYPVGVERGFMSRAAAVERTLRTLRFFWSSAHGPEPDATGYKGFYYHFLDMQTGRRAWQCELSTVDTHVPAGRRVDGGGCISSADTAGRARDPRAGRRAVPPSRLAMGAKRRRNRHARMDTRSGFITYRWEGYDEALLLYVLGLGSPTHPLPDEELRRLAARRTRGSDLRTTNFSTPGRCSSTSSRTSGSTFAASRTRSCASRGIDYFENSRRATYVQRSTRSATRTSSRATDATAGESRASDGPGPTTTRIDGVERQFFGYVARGRSVRARRRHARAVGGGRVAAVCSRDRAAGALLLYSRGQAHRIEPVRIQVVIQRDLSGGRWRRQGLDIAVACWNQPGSDRVDDRESSNWVVVGVDPTMPVPRRGPTPSGVYGGMAMTSQARP